MTGFRVGLGGAQELFNIHPISPRWAKSSGPLPVGAYGASNELMEQMPLMVCCQAGTIG